MIGVGDFKADNRTRELVNKVLTTGRLSYGPISREFEQEFSKIHGCAFGVLSNSGTSSLQVALQAMKEIHGWQDGDEVIIPALTFVATANIVLHNNMKPVPIDIDMNSYNMDWMRLENALTDKTRAVIPVHLFGQPADVTMIRAVLYENNVDAKIIEDSCETMFANHRGRPVGSLGDIGCFSMYVAHILSAGVGGIATTNNPEYAKVMRSLVNHGRDNIYISIDDDGGRQVMEKRFNFERVGHSYRITEFEAALALAQLEQREFIVSRRQENAASLTRYLSDLRVYLEDNDVGYTGYLWLPGASNGNDHVFMMYPIVVADGNKWPLCEYLEENGIETREMLPLTNQPIYEGLFDEDRYPMAKWVNKGGFYVGCHQHLTDDDMYYIARTIKDYYGVR